MEVVFNADGSVLFQRILLCFYDAAKRRRDPTLGRIMQSRFYFAMSVAVPGVVTLRWPLSLCKPIQRLRLCHAATWTGPT